MLVKKLDSRFMTPEESGANAVKFLRPFVYRNRCVYNCKLEKNHSGEKLMRPDILFAAHWMNVFKDE